MQSTACAILPSISLLLTSSSQLPHMLLFISALARRLGSDCRSEKIESSSRKEMAFPSNIRVHLYHRSLLIEQVTKLCELGQQLTLHVLKIGAALKCLGHQVCLFGIPWLTLEVTGGSGPVKSHVAVSRSGLVFKEARLNSCSWWKC